MYHFSKGAKGHGKVPTVSKVSVAAASVETILGDYPIRTCAPLASVTEPTKVA